jgi:hypothetical protein
MPLDEFQLSVLRSMADLRTPSSVLAGGSALHQHGWRLSDDLDVFNDASSSVAKVFQTDARRLRERGYEVDPTTSFEGFQEAIVAREAEGSTIVQWVQYSGANYYAPVRDDDFGYRLSMVDLAINKVVAAASRRKPRDLLDLRMVASVVPLWNAICAAPGKDASLTPHKTLAMIKRNAQYGRSEIEDAAILPDGADPSAFASRVRTLLDKAEAHLDHLPKGGAGSLLVDRRGSPLLRPPSPGETWTARAPTFGPVWPSGPEIDGAVNRRLVRRCGERGAKLWARRGDPPEPGGPGR